MIRLVEGLQRDLPVAVEVQPLAPLVAHVLQSERVENLRCGEQVVHQRLAVGIHVDPQPAAPGVDLDWGQVRVLRRQRAFPVVLLTNVRARAVQSVCPAVESAHEGLAGPAARVFCALGRVDQPPPAVHADVVVGCELVRSGAHDDDRVVEDVVGQVAADLGKLVDPADLLPHFSPQLVALRAGVVLGGVRLDGDRQRLGEFFCGLSFGSALDVGHQNSFIAVRKDSSLRNNEVLSAARWLHLRFSPPSTSSVWPVT